MRKWIAVCLSLILILLLGWLLPKNLTVSGQRLLQPGGGIAAESVLAAVYPVQPSNDILVYLPLTWRTYPWSSVFGVESAGSLQRGSLLLSRATRLPTKWVRLNNRISWRQLQPGEGDPVQWDLLANFENELRALQALGITPIVVVDDYPAWATAERNGLPSYCGPMRSDKFTAFADFVSQLVDHFKVPEFNLHVWELGNEPDVDGSVYSLPLDSEYGCWGDWQDPYYGGEAYGEMLMVVAPVIKAADPLAQVWVGGLLLNSPSTNKPGEGHPELFMQGILQAGIGTNYSYFDVLPYHAYSIYTGQDIDYDNAASNSPWFGDPWGGVILGKSRFLRSIMDQYGVQKPLFVNEISLTCPEYISVCNPPGDDFFEMQANHLVRVLVRGLGAGVTGFTWYTLDGPGWRYGSLLDNAGVPRASYLAYQKLIQQLINTTYSAPADYGVDFEAYAFRRGPQEVDLVWSRVDVPDLVVQVPVDKWIEARTRDGTLIAPILVDGSYQIPVGFSPVYIIRSP